MKCDKIRLLLDEYIKDTLSNPDKLLVETHIESCKNCLEEVEFLKKYFDVAKMIPKKEAPKNLLNNIKKKLEAETFIDKIKTIFLYPVKVKIPLELFGVAATVLLIFMLLHPFNLMLKEKKQIAFGEKMLREESKDLSKNKMDTDEVLITDEKKEVSADRLNNEKPLSSKKEKRVLTDFTKNDDFFKSEETESVLESKKEKTIILYNIALNIIKNESLPSISDEEDKSYSLTKSIEPKYMKKKAVPNESKSEILDAEKGVSPKENEEKMLGYTSKTENIYNDIEQIIIDLGGKIISDKNLNKTNTIDLEISEENYEKLITELNQVGKTQSIKKSNDAFELNLLLK